MSRRPAVFLCACGASWPVIWAFIDAIKLRGGAVFYWNQIPPWRDPVNLYIVLEGDDPTQWRVIR